MLKKFELFPKSENIGRVLRKAVTVRFLHQKFYYDHSITNGSEGTNVKIQKLMRNYRGNSYDQRLWLGAG